MKALLFDFGGTLDSDGLTWKDRFFSLYREEGVDAAPAQFDRAFYDADDRLAERHDLRGLDLGRTAALQVSDALTALGRPQPALAARIAERFVGDCRRHFERNRPVLERLSKRFRLGIVSNFYGNLSEVLRAERLDGLFGAVADSGAVGHEKPAPGIFLHAAGALGVAAADCLMVGDSIPRDMKGAEGLGMRHALLTSGGRACCSQALTLRSLPELEARLS